MSFDERNHYLIDWLSFTVRSSDPLEVIEKVGLQELNLEMSSSGRYGYEKGYSDSGLVNVFYSEKRSDMGVHVEMTGQGVRKFEALMERQGVDWFEVLGHLQSFVKFSRIDLALDEFEGLVDFNKIIEKIEKGEHVGRCRSFKVISGRDSNGAHTGTTIYLGSKKSDVMLRIYEKNYERQQKGYEITTDIWNRWELVLKHEKANNFVSELLNNGYSFGGLFKGIIGDLIRFVEPSSDRNKRRWKQSPWWVDFLEGVEPIQLKGKEYQPNLAKTLNWVEKSTLTALKGLSEIASKEDIDFFGELSKMDNYNKEKVDKMVNEYVGLRGIEKQKFINLLKSK